MGRSEPNRGLRRDRPNFQAHAKTRFPRPDGRRTARPRSSSPCSRWQQPCWQRLAKNDGGQDLRPAGRAPQHPGVRGDGEARLCPWAWVSAVRSHRLRRRQRHTASHLQVPRWRCSSAPRGERPLGPTSGKLRLHSWHSLHHRCRALSDVRKFRSRHIAALNINSD